VLNKKAVLVTAFFVYEFCIYHQPPGLVVDDKYIGD